MVFEDGRHLGDGRSGEEVEAFVEKRNVATELGIVVPKATAHEDRADDVRGGSGHKRPQLKGLSMLPLDVAQQLVHFDLESKNQFFYFLGNEID